jgi:hypothetical protein
VDNLNWRFEQDAQGRSVVRHRAPPRFTAYWTSGAEAPAADGWRDPGSGDDQDSLHLFGFRWIDPAPEGAAFDRLMREAATAIDAWIASRF